MVIMKTTLLKETYLLLTVHKWYYRVTIYVTNIYFCGTNNVPDSNTFIIIVTITVTSLRQIYFVVKLMQLILLLSQLM